MPTLNPPLERPFRAPTTDWTRHPINLNIADEPFLVDHQVGGHPLLPTVMATDALAWAVIGDAASGPLEIYDLRVAHPVRFDAGPTRRLEVRTRPAEQGRIHSELTTGESHDGIPHFSATISTGGDVLPLPPAERPFDTTDRLPLAAADIYPPYFHGPLLQVIDRARVDPDGVTARLSPVPALTWSTRPTVSAPALLELCLQACGLWELQHTGRMMIPSRVDAIVVPVPESRLGDRLAGAEARVRPGPKSGPTGDGGRVFDGTVRDRSGTVLLEVRGYHTVSLAGSEAPS